jgi:hypothetical protein
MRRHLAILIAILAPLAHAADKLKLDDVIAKHLASIGTPEARAAAKTRLAEGKADMQEVVRGSSALHGNASVACDNRRVKIAMQFPGASQYPGEQWVFDGNQAQVAQTAPGARSSIGNFVYQHPELLREGLLGGSTFLSWSLLDLDARQPRLKYEGLKKINGRELHQLSYTPKKGSALQVRLFFDPETFHHVKTIYTFEVGAGLGAGAIDHPDEVRHTLEENFDNFQTVDGLTLPASWNLRYEVTPSASAVLEWSIKLDRFKHNEQL